MTGTTPLAIERPSVETGEIGLTEAEARRRLEKFGPNAVAGELPRAAAAKILPVPNAIWGLPVSPFRAPRGFSPA